MKTLLHGLALVWRALDQTRRALLNLLLLALIALALWTWLRPGPAALKDNTTLVLTLRGNLVEQLSGSLRERARSAAQGSELPRQVRLRDVLLAIDEAARDPKIGRLVLDIDELGAAGLASLHEVAAAVQRFKAAGKPVLSWGEGYSQAQYYLAAQAHEVYLHPLGQVALQGMGRHRLYYKDLFDRLGVQAHVIRAGRYKNFAEPYAASAPSPETLEAEGALYGDLWRQYAEGIEKARGQPPGSLMRGIERVPQLMSEAQGDLARLALDAKLVDGLMTPEAFRAHLIKKGAAIEEPAKPGREPQVRQVGFGEYLARLKPRGSGDAVGVIVAEGGIVNGEAGPGGVGGHSTAALVRAAREDDKIKALVLRVRSPGGSAFASEQVRHELDLTRKAGKPVVVSMGDVAASGGYLISMSADEILADPATITGSIGVIAMLPSMEAAVAKLGLHTGGVSTTWLGDGYDPLRGLEPRFEKIVQQSIDHFYADFLAKVATARKSTPEKIDAVAQGRVWTGAQALERGLVDRLGLFGDAVKSAAQRAKIEGEPRLVYLEHGRSRWERLAGWFIGLAGLDPTEGDAAGALPSALPSMAGRLLAPELAALDELLRAAAPQGHVAPMPLLHCGCGIDLR